MTYKAPFRVTDPAVAAACAVPVAPVVPSFWRDTLTLRLALCILRYILYVRHVTTKGPVGVTEGRSQSLGGVPGARSNIGGPWFLQYTKKKEHSQGACWCSSWPPTARKISATLEASWRLQDCRSFTSWLQVHRHQNLHRRWSRRSAPVTTCFVVQWRINMKHQSYGNNV